MKESEKIPLHYYVWIFFLLVVLFVVVPFSIWHDSTHELVCTDTDIIKTVEGYTSSKYSHSTIVTLNGDESVRSVTGLHKVGDEVCTKTEYLKVK